MLPTSFETVPVKTGLGIEPELAVASGLVSGEAFGLTCNSVFDFSFSAVGSDFVAFLFTFKPFGLPE